MSQCGKFEVSPCTRNMEQSAKRIGDCGTVSNSEQHLLTDFRFQTSCLPRFVSPKYATDSCVARVLFRISI